MSNGWVCIHRKMLEWEWFDDQNVFRLYMTLLLLANHKDNKWRGKLVEKGSLVTGIASLSAKTGLSVRKVRTALDKLIMTGEITRKTTNEYSIISITNWEVYQEKDKQDDKPVTSERQTDDKRMTPNNNDKQLNKENKDQKTTVEQEVFDFWKNTFNHSRSIFDSKRKALIKSAIKLGFSKESCFAAITGCSKTPHNIGENDTGTKYDGIHIIFKDAAQIERFINNSTNPPQSKINNVLQMQVPEYIPSSELMRGGDIIESTAETL